jgi:hypothetical protein
MRPYGGVRIGIDVVAAVAVAVGGAFVLRRDVGAILAQRRTGG